MAISQVYVSQLLRQESYHRNANIHSQSNVLITAAGKPCLADFGLSKIMAEFEGTSYLTGTGGAVRWAAFELYHVYGDDDEPQPALISKQSDIYSFGSIILQVSPRSSCVLRTLIILSFIFSDAVGQDTVLLYPGTSCRRDTRPLWHAAQAA